ATGVIETTCNGVVIAADAICARGVLDWRYRMLAPMRFATGWSSVVALPDGVLFYNRGSGLKVTGQVNASGIYSDEPVSVETLPVAYDKIVAVGTDLLFYRSGSGEAAVGALSVLRRVVWKQLLPSSVFGEWSSICTVEVPPLEFAPPPPPFPR